MRLSELKKVGFEAVASSLKTEHWGKPAVQFGALGFGHGSPVALNQKHLESIVDDLIQVFGDVQAGTKLVYGRTYVIPNCPRYKERMSDEAAERFREHLKNDFGTTE